MAAVRIEIGEGLLRREAAHKDPLLEVRREKVGRWFEARADAFINHAARGMFRKTIHPDHIVAEFRAIARALGGEGQLLEDWFETRAHAFIDHKRGPIDLSEIKAEFKILGREYSDIMHRFEADPVEVELQAVIQQAREEELQRLVQK